MDRSGPGSRAGVTACSAAIARLNALLEASRAALAGLDDPAMARALRLSPADLRQARADVTGFRDVTWLGLALSLAARGVSYFDIDDGRAARDCAKAEEIARFIRDPVLAEMAALCRAMAADPEARGTARR
jgi:hypothetical protein